MGKPLGVLCVAVAAIFLCTSVAARQESRLGVIVDPRIELLSVVEFLAGYRLITPFDFAYKREIEEHFGGHRKHEAVSLFARMVASGFGMTRPPEAMMHLSNPPELDVVAPFTTGLEGAAGGREMLQEFIIELRQFSRDTDFMAFFRKHGPTYRQLIDDVQGKLHDMHIPGLLYEYFGSSATTCTCVLVPLQGRESFGVWVDLADGRSDAYCVHGPCGVIDDLPWFGGPGRLEGLAIHELGHAFVNPVADSFAAEIAQYHSLFDPVSDMMRRNLNGTWHVTSYENVLRAVHARLTTQMRGEPAGQASLNRDRDLGYFYTKPIYEALKRYEGARDVYPTFASFYPEILRVFAQLAEEEPGTRLARLCAPFWQLTGNYAIWMMDADGSSTINVIDSRGRDWHPALSPDGSMIAFDSDRDGDHEIYLANTDGSGLAQLTHNSEDERLPTWSADGSQLAFQSDVGRRHRLYVVNAAGSGWTMLSGTGSWDFHPAWSPDGHRIAFMSGVDICVMDADGTGAAPLTGGVGRNWDPAWSPDGKRIAYGSDRDGNWEIYTMAADGSEQTRLTENTADDARPTWAPDGSRIAFESNRTGRWQIHAMDADGSGQRRLSDGSHNEGMATWSRDGSRIVFVRVLTESLEEGRPVRPVGAQN